MLASLPQRSTIVPQAEELRSLQRKMKVKQASSALKSLVEYSRQQDIAQIMYQLAAASSVSDAADDGVPAMGVHRGHDSGTSERPGSSPGCVSDGGSRSARGTTGSGPSARGARLSGICRDGGLGSICLDEFQVRDGSSDQQVFVRSAIGKLHKWCPMILRHYLYTDAKSFKRPGFVCCSDIPFVTSANSSDVQRMISNLPPTPVSHLLAVLQHFHSDQMKKAVSIHRGRTAAELYRLRLVLLSSWMGLNVHHP